MKMGTSKAWLTQGVAHKMKRAGKMEWVAHEIYSARRPQCGCDTFPHVPERWARAARDTSVDAAKFFKDWGISVGYRARSRVGECL